MIEQLLLNSPYFVRTLAANVKSWQLDRLRRGGDWLTIRQANSFQRYFDQTWDMLLDAQEQLLVEMVSHAREHVPYYRTAHQNIPSLTSRAQLAEIPFLTKRRAVQAGKALLDAALLSYKHYEGHTSGSTGTPFTFYWSLDALRTRFAMRDNFYTLHGCDFADRSVRVGGRLFLSATKKKPPFWLLDRVTNQLMFSVYHMSDETMNFFLEPIRQYQPVFVTGYPSGIYLLARFCRKQGFAFTPRAVFTDSETLLDYQREEIEAAWNCPVHDYLGMEAGWITGQCRKGNYHISPLTGVVEIIDEQGRAQKPGEIGEIVVTDLTNKLMPLIRYRTGDTARWSTEQCDCGWNTPIIERIEGRADDIVVLPDGRKIGRLDHIFKYASHIQECQIVQESSNRLVFYIVPDDGYNTTIADKILHEARLRLGTNVEIVIELVTGIPRTKAGKFCAVICQVEPPK